MAKAKIEFKSDIPETALEIFAQCLLDDIVDFFSSEEGQKEFEDWKKKQTEDKKE